MPVKDRGEAQDERSEVELLTDERWLLIQRIVESHSFERALQLRKILVYVTKSALLYPDRVLHEYDIACDVLERRKDFDPTSDNIVRSQFSHLRRKLELYFLDEGKGETLFIKIPKGSYLPLFAPLKAQTPGTPAPSSSAVAPVETVQGAIAPSVQSSQGIQPRWKRRTLLLIALCLSPSLVLTIVLLWPHKPAPATADAPTPGNAFVRFLGRTEGDVSVVAPDLSLVLLKQAASIDQVPLAEYTSHNYPQNLIKRAKTPEVAYELQSISEFQLTTFMEATTVADLVETMNKLGVHAKPRFPRDMQVGDLNDGNTILIGSPSSNPWGELFTDHLNFRWVEDSAGGNYHFDNLHPKSGELRTYPVNYPGRLENTHTSYVGYIDVALTQNPSHSGYVMLFDGSDSDGVYSAERYLLHGTLPPEIATILNRKDLHYFEIFLRGTRINGQADSAFELVAYRAE
jgi:hypothetical protein